jgi:hypothetical protein
LVAAYVNAEVEPYVAINPRNRRNLISVYQEDRYPNDGANGVLTSVSFDAGRSWAVPPLGQQPPFSRCAGGNQTNGGDFEKATDPWVDFGPTGVAYQAAVSYNDSNWDTAELVSTSTNGGRSWGKPAAVIRENIPNVIDDRPAVTADPTRPHSAYVVWERHLTAPAAVAAGAAWFSRTSDDGATWSTARPIYTSPVGMQTSANQIVVLPNGDLLDVFTELGLGTGFDHPRHDRILVIRSSDGGQTWSGLTTLAQSFVNGVRDPRTDDQVRVGDSFTDIAVDRRAGTATVYAVWGDAGFTSGGAQQIAFSRSTDGGRSWSPPIRVSANVATQAFVPSVAVNDAGQVAITYHDFTSDTQSSVALTTDYWITRSTDQGRTWSQRQRVTERPFDLRTAPFNHGFFLGEYQGFVGAGRSFSVVATFTNGHDLQDRTDVFARLID